MGRWMDQCHVHYALTTYAFLLATMQGLITNNVLDLGRDVVTIKRVRVNNTKEYIKYCGSGETEPRCKGFVTEDGEPATPASKAHVQKDGKLIFDPFAATDAGLYSSPDQGPIVTNKSGAYFAVLNKHISLIVKEQPPSS
ncbi:hypothetical protein KIN20_012612 [Parelaphostrongylus tenuis]|uniref:Uncharacterized protein n=1 Tax=Parelaphostrongylus tenuis TaxID=148309 RepID=A0AAD5MWG9_PARTN|nr:hypothetical protein KIN20_012612 [Parelaphostrongylus tenuis]